MGAVDRRFMVTVVQSNNHAKKSGRDQLIQRENRTVQDNICLSAPC